MVKIDLWDEWTVNWQRAKAFFESKGNLATKTRLKRKWMNEFKSTLERVRQCKT